MPVWTLVPVSFYVNSYLSGDVLDTTPRIRPQRNRYGVNCTASSELPRRLRLGAAAAAVPSGAIRLGGKAQTLEPSAVRPVAAVR